MDVSVNLCYSVELFNTLILSPKEAQKIIKYVRSGFTYNSNAVMPFSSMLKWILDTSLNYGSTGQRVTHAAARPFSFVLKCHMKI